MSEFLEELAMHIADSQVLKYAVGYEKDAEVVNEYSIGSALNMIVSLGENAQRMMEVGFLQDNLIGLGFKKIVSGYELEAGGYLFIDELVSDKEYQYFDKELDETTVGKLCVTFHADRCVICIDEVQICALSHERALDKVKELINEAN